MSAVVIVASDLLFQSRISAAVHAAGAVSMLADAESADSALRGAPALLIIDLHERGLDAPELISKAKAAGVRVLAFGRHTEPGLLREARTAGAERVVPRSQLAEELPQLLESLLAAVPGGSSGGVPDGD